MLTLYFILKGFLCLLLLIVCSIFKFTKDYNNTSCSQSYDEYHNQVIKEYWDA